MDVRHTTGFPILLAAVAILAHPKVDVAAAKKTMPKVFLLNEAGIELTLTDAWFPQPVPPGRHASYIFTSLRDLAQISVTLLPYQIEIDETSLEARSAELLLTIKSAYPDFVHNEPELTPGASNGLYIEGKWTVDGKPTAVSIKVLPARGKTILIVLESQTPRRTKLVLLRSLIKNGTKIVEMPLTPPRPPSVVYTMAGARVQVNMPQGWRPVTEKEVTFLAHLMDSSGLFADVELLEKSFILANPTLTPVSPTLTFRSSPATIPVNPDDLERFEMLYRSALPATIDNRPTPKISIEQLGGVDSYLVTTEAERGGIQLLSRQYFTPTPAGTIITTLTCPLEVPPGNSIPECISVLEGVVFDLKNTSDHPPPHPPSSVVSDPFEGQQKSARSYGTDEKMPLWGLLAVATAAMAVITLLSRRLVVRTSRRK